MLLVAAALFAVNGAFAESKSFLLAGGNMTVTQETVKGGTLPAIMTGTAGDTAEGIILTRI